MSATIVQHAESGVSTQTTSVTVANPTQNNLLIAWVNSNNTASTPTDNGSNSGWTAGPSVVDGNGVYIWYRLATSTDASSLTSVSYTSGSANFSLSAGALEVSGLVTSSFFDKQGTATATGSAASSTPALTAITTTGANGDFVFALAGLHSTAAQSTSAQSWTNSFVDLTLSPRTVGSGTTAMGTFAASLDQATAGSITTQCSWTTNVLDRQILIISFKLAAAGGAAGIPDLAMAPRTGG